MNFSRVLQIVSIMFLSVALVPVITTAQKTWEPDQTFSAPGPEPECVTWDGKALWLADNNTKEIYKLDPEDGSVITSFRLTVEEAKALAWDGSHLWVLDNKTKMICKLDPSNGNIVTKIEAPAPVGEGPWSLEGLTWDGKYLWVAYYAGFSSKINQVDPGDGTIIQSFFSDSYPRGLASDGKNLWSICYNGEKLPATIDVRHISEKSFDMAKSRSFSANLPTKDTTSLTFDGKYLWSIDKSTRNIHKFEVK